jgi:hypothetical protein
MRPRRNTYTAYSIGCAGVWGVILLIARRRLDPATQDTLRIVCGGWWMGWTSATIARVGYPPPEPLTPAAEKRLRIVSTGLVALGLINIIRLLAAGKRPARSAPDT